MKKLITLTVVAFFISVVSLNAQMNNKMGRAGKKMDMNCKKDMMNKGMSMHHNKTGLLAYGYMFYQKIANDIKLTDKQLDKIKNLDFEVKEKLIDLRAQQQHLRLEMRKLFLADKFDKQAVLSLQKKMSDIRDKMMDLNFKTKVEMYSVLTDEQRKKLRDLKMQRGMFGGRRFYDDSDDD